MKNLKITLKNLNLSKESNLVLSNITLNFFSGYTYLIYGRNGAGKSSLFNCLLNFENNYRGKLIFFKNGEKISLENLKKTYLPEVIDMPDQVKISDYMNSFEVLLKNEGRFNEKLFISLCEKFEINSFSAKEFGQLSKGMKKLILLALTLSSESNLIILDEPLEGLDLISKEHLIDVLMSEAKKGKIVIVSSHEVATLHNRFDMMISLRNGKITKELNKGEELDYQALLNFI